MIKEHRDFCRAVRERREDLNLTQAAVAKRLQISQPAYAQIESGRSEPTIGQVARVAKALECSFTQLFADPVHA